jgi:hypothetical protein
MDLTSSNSFVLDAGTGQRMHVAAQAVPTQVSDVDMNGVIWELVALIKAAGVVPTAFDKTVPASYKQVVQAARRLFGGNLRTITAAGTTVLTADDAGLVLIDATANAVTVTLPAVNAVTGAPLIFEFVRIDGSANAVAINRAGADTFVGGSTGFTLVGQKDQRSLVGDAVSKWTVTSPGGNQLLAANGYREIGGGLILQWGSTAGLSSAADTNVNLPIAFTSSFYGVLLTQSYTPNSGVVGYSVGVPVSMSQFTARSNGTGYGNFFVALGK